MGRTHNIIVDKEKDQWIRQSVRKQEDGTEYTIFKGEVWIVEVDHQYQIYPDSKVMVTVYRLVRKAKLV